MNGSIENLTDSVIPLTNLTSSVISPSYYMVIEGSVIGALIVFASTIYLTFLSSICCCNVLDDDGTCAGQYSTGLQFVYKMFFSQFIEIGVHEFEEQGKKEKKTIFFIWWL